MADVVAGFWQSTSFSDLNQMWKSMKKALFVACPISQKEIVSNMTERTWQMNPQFSKFCLLRRNESSS